MNVDGVKITWVGRDEFRQQQNRQGFTSVCQYGIGMDMEPNELGAICEPRRGAPVWASGLFVQGVRVLERIFIVEPS